MYSIELEIILEILEIIVAMGLLFIINVITDNG